MLALKRPINKQLDRMIRHHVDQLGERLERQYTVLGEWLPRVLYLLILLYLVLA